MAQADSNNTTRRRFLSTAAGIAAGGAVLTLATPPAIAADDPVIALIETHRAAHAALVAAIYQDADDGSTEAAHEAEQSALVDLIHAVPATLAGVIATMRYIADVAPGDIGHLCEDEINPFLANLASALESFVVTS